MLNHYLLKREQLESFVVNTIHDSIISEVKPEEEEEYNAIGKWAFTTGVLEYLDVVYNLQFKVPMDSDSKTTPYWGVSMFPPMMLGLKVFTKKVLQ